MLTKDKLIFRRRVAGAIGLFIVGVLMGVGVCHIPFGSVSNLVLEAVGPGKMKNTNILVIGIDETKGVQRSDTIMFLHVGEDYVGLLAIPRDTRAYVDGVGITKINHAYAYGGVDLSKKAVSDFLGVPIDHYLKLNLAGVSHIVDQLGGVTVNVEKRMYYVDRAGGLTVDLQPGEHLLMGNQAVSYLRFRHDALGDIGRVKRQREFLFALGADVLSVGEIFKNPGLLAELSQYIDTSLSQKELLSLCLTMKDVQKTNRILTDMVPGVPAYISGVSYWQADPEHLKTVLDQILTGPSETPTENVVPAETPSN